MSIAKALLVALSVVWAIRAGRTFGRRHAAAGAQPSWIDAALAVAVGGLLWLNYVRAIDPSIRWPTDVLLPGHYIHAGRGIVVMRQYAALLLFVAAFAASFVLVGHFICRTTGFSTVAAVDVGASYFVGMAAFLTAYVGAAILTGRVRAAALAIVIVFAAMSAYAVARLVPWNRARAWIVGNCGTILRVMPLIVAALCLLHFVVLTRAGLKYEEFAEQIAASDRLPLLNRHFGQSLLASVGVMAFGTGAEPFAFSRVLINQWLYVSQIALVLLLYGFLRALSVSRPGAVAGVVVLMLGNSALSLLPYIMYDHDYPLMLNVYADSVFGIAGSLIIALYLFSITRRRALGTSQPSSARASVLVPALIMIAFNYTAELNTAIVFLVVGVLLLVNASSGSWPWARLATLVVVCAVATLIGIRGGGILSARIRSEANPENTVLERQASSARITLGEPRWWYLPSKIVGFETGYGNLPVPNVLLRARQPDLYAEGVASYSESSNASLIAAYDESRTWAGSRNLIYVVELRVLHMIQAIWFPLTGVVGLGVLLWTRPAAPNASDVEIETLRLFWLIAATAFFGSVAFVFLANTVDGNGVYWKWALTRVLEPGLCLATIALVVAIDRITLAFESPLRRGFAWAVIVLVTSFGPLYRILCFDLRV